MSVRTPIAKCWRLERASKDGSRYDASRSISAALQKTGKLRPRAVRKHHLWGQIAHVPSMGAEAFDVVG